MQAFVAVADHQGFAPAARKLGLSPSGVTRLIAALEDRLGARLLQRTTRQVTLTDIGARYLERVRRILADVEEAEAAPEKEYISELERKLAQTVSSLELSVRASHCLSSEKIETLDQLVRMTEDEILKVRSFGKTSLREVKRKLADLGLSLGMDLEGAIVAEKESMGAKE